MDDEKFMEKLESLRGTVYSKVIHLFGGRTYGSVAVDDVVQETFFNAYRKRSQFRYRGKGSLRNWVLRISVNTFLNVKRRIDRNGEDEYKLLEELIEEDGCDLDSDLLESESFTEFMGPVADLLKGSNGGCSDSQRRNVYTFLVKELSGLTYEELSECLGRRVGSLKSSWNRGKKELQRVLSY